MNELFTPPLSDSPRVQWMKRYGVKTMAATDDRLSIAWFDRHGATPPEVFNRFGEAFMGFGENEDEAVVNLAIAHGLALWNEEQP